MLSRLYFRKLFVLSLLIGISSFFYTGMTFAANGSDESDDGAEVLTRGPIHEAFADVSVDDAAPVTVTSRKVPDPIKEIPPDYRPEGEHVEWIPGYWSWDEDQNDFIWISGVWRDIPPGRQWIPGYWMSVEGGNQYVSGYWANTEQTAMEYLPPPPKPLEAPPSSPPLTADHVWMNGTWVWHDNHFAWQSGYWYEPRPDMIWIPAHYVWTPRGYIFVRGYWDYQFDRRGVMFAPVYYARPIYTHHDYHFSPRIVLDCDAIILSLFIHRDSRRYYFGDYYDVRYVRRGFSPWFSIHATHYGYDPFYRHYRWRQLRHDHDWENNYHRQFEYRRDHIEARPPHRFTRQTNHDSGQLHSPATQMIGRRFSDIVDRRDQKLQFTRVHADHRREFESRDRQLGELQVERRKLEGQASKDGTFRKHTDLKQPVSLKMPSSPIKAPPASRENSSSFSRSQGKSQDKQRLEQKGPSEHQTEAVRQKRQIERPETQPEIKPQTEQQGKQSRRSQVQPQSQVQTESQRREVVRPQTQPEVQLQTEQQGKQSRRSQVQPQSQPQTESQRREVVRPQTQPEVQPQTEQQGKQSRRSQVQPQSQPQTEPQRREVVRPQTQPEVQPQAEQQGKQFRRPQAQPEQIPQENPLKSEQLKSGNQFGGQPQFERQQKDGFLRRG